MGWVIQGNCPSTGNSDLFTNGMDGITEDTIPTGWFDSCYGGGCRAFTDDC